MMRLQKSRQAQRLSEEELRALGANISASQPVLEFLRGYLQDRLQTLEKSLDGLVGDDRQIFADLGARKEIRTLLWQLEETTKE